MALQSAATCRNIMRLSTETMKSAIKFQSKDMDLYVQSRLQTGTIRLKPLNLSH